MAKNDVRNGKIDGVSSGEVVKYEQDGMPSLEVWLEDETIWLTQKQMGELFGVREHTITYHIKGIVESGELEGMATTRKIRVVRLEGNRQVSRQIDFYNLEMIISVGYRVNSRRGVLFRRWATSVLKEYLLRGSVRDLRLSKLEKRMTAARSVLMLISNLDERGLRGDQDGTSPCGGAATDWKSQIVISNLSETTVRMGLRKRARCKVLRIH